MKTDKKYSGFTLIELSIVLVIIGLIVGGVLVGQDLIRAAGVRATISQIEKYQTAVNTFRGKYNALPGDLNAAAATQFGFAPRGQYAGEGDGNGIIEGISANSAGNNCGVAEGAGETLMFWEDLSTANGVGVNLIDGSFNTGSLTVPLNVGSSDTSSPPTSAYFPAAKIGRGNYILVWSGGWADDFCNIPGDGTNYFAITVTGAYTHTAGLAGLTVSEAYSIDKKVDDGFPQQGNITALVPYSSGAYWTSGGSMPNGATLGTGSGYAPTTAATPGSATTCYDNNNTVGPQQYSVEQNGGAGVNCGLSFRFQ